MHVTIEWLIIDKTSEIIFCTVFILGENCLKEWCFVTAPSGYFNVKIQGTTVQVYCQMDLTPAESYFDLSAYSIWGGSIYWYMPPMSKETVLFSKARIVYDSCFILIDRTNTRFRTGTSTRTDMTMS